MQINQTAPVKATGRIIINAPLQKVWSLMSDINQWPSWNLNIKEANLEGQLKPGTLFRWKSGPGMITSRLTVVDPEQTIAWSGKSMGITAIHITHFEKKENSTIVITEESFDGVLVHLFKGYMQKTLDKATLSSLKILKATAEAVLEQTI